MDLFRRCQTCGGEGRGTVTVTQPDGTEMEHVCPDCDFEGYVPVEVSREAVADVLLNAIGLTHETAVTARVAVFPMADAVLALLRGETGRRG